MNTPKNPNEALRDDIRALTDRLLEAAEYGGPIAISSKSSDLAVLDLVYAIQAALDAEREAAGESVDDDDLNRVIQVRTAELDHARSVAEYSSRAKSDFLARMSHELRTPLNAIIGFAQLILDSKRDPISDRQVRQMTHILNGGRHLLGLINDVLDLSSIEAGRLEMHIEPIEPRALIAESLQMTEALKSQYSVTLENRLPDDVDLPNVACDFLRAKQCLINFINNAYKYNRDGGVVWVSAEVIGGETVRFLVGDTGIGIPESRQHEMFMPFSRLGRESTEIEGSGVGLALTKMLIYAMGGTVDFESAPDKGSVFWFDLPVTELAVGAAEPIPKAKPVPEEMVGRILVIEDSAANLELMKDVLEAYPNIHLITATTGEEGVELAVSEQPDVVLTDINLTGMNGIDVARYLRNVPETADMPVFAISADALSETRQRCFEAGMNGFFAKPIDVLDLTHSIAGTLRYGRHASPDGELQE